jgi:dTDP-4-amino-4,6-dideoxygalactose transaminase
MSDTISFIDLAAQQARILPRIEAAISRVLAHGGYIMGPEIAELERQLSAFANMRETVSCASGTDALVLPLMAWGIKPGDAVFCPSFTFAATAEIVAWLGATPVFVDVLPETFNMDPAGLRRAIGQVRQDALLTPRVVIAVDLFGQAADYPALREICDEHGLKLVSDAAQGFGATLDGQMSGAWADVVATSFFPAKPLGCYGDGGAVLTNDVELSSIMRSLRVHGKGEDKYDNVRIGMNGRLDTIQAAILIEKLAIFPDEIEARERVAQRYADGLGIVTKVPFVPSGHRSTWAQYTLTLEPGQRDNFASAMKERGVPTAIYYPKPLHRQTAYRNFPSEGNGLPVSDGLAERVISLPMHPYLDEKTQDRIISAVREAVAHVRSAAA